MKSPTRRLVLGAFAAPLLPRLARAEEWPNRPIRLVVPFAPGGTTDVMARLLADRLGQALGRPMVVDNKPGAGATIGSATVAQAAPDGYVLVMSNSTSHGVSPALYPQMPYDALTGFTHIALVATSPSVLVVNKDHPARDMAGFVAQCRKDKEIVLAISGVGTSSHLAGVRLGMLLDLPVRTIPYRGAGPAMNDVVGGAVPAMMDSLPSAGGVIRDGLVRAMALTSAQRVRTFPDLPTMKEAGIDLVNNSWFGLSGPPNLPPAITQRIAEATATVLKDPATIERFETLLGAPPPSSTPESYTQFVRDELATFAPIVRAAKIEL